MAQVVVRVVLAAFHGFPILIPDESGYLLAARLLAGGASSDLSGRVFYQAGYSLLICPAFWLSGDPVTVYRIVLVINAVLGASLLVPAHVALRRLGLSRRRAFPLAMVTASLPSVVYYGQYAMSDAVLPLVVLTWLLCVHSWVARRGPGWGIAASALAAYCCSAHVRGLIVVLVHGGLLVVLLVRRRLSGRDLAASAAVLAVGVVAGWALNSWVRAEIYPGGPMALGPLVVERLTTWDGWGWTLGLAVGKIWYLTVSTWGLAGVGLVAAARAVLRRSTPLPTRATAGLALATLAGIALATSAATPDEGTVANFAYGRYVACLAPALFLAGAACVARATRVTAAKAVAAAAVLMPVCALVVWLHAGVRLTRSFFLSLDFPEMSALTWSWDRLRLWWVTAAVLVLLPGLVLAKGRRAGPVLAALVTAANLALVAAVVGRDTRYWADTLSKASSLSDAGLRPEDRVGIDYRDMRWQIWVSQAFLVQSHLQPIDRFDSRTLPRGLTLVIVPWDPQQPPRGTWPAAPLEFVPISAHWSDSGSWVAWRRR
ncbi:hypothetical protein [Actinoallomurus rhizosphaericola]|uniref:hypothetical protein n=1 Tax=Actinoallomurus rhizosphaericola TaxID=2952536 RepID=UPI0020928234|nr:hypothetical protein [Actinoallomurus rhizosphaericola]MCO5997848.1 hypothetical protein [Actinoallomurus rhizosphaericola]